MRTLDQLEKEARDRRAKFDATLLDVQSRLTLRGLAKEGLRHIDPHFVRLPPAFHAVKRHPIVAAVALAGASWLLKQVLRPARRAFKNGSARPSSYSPITPAKLKTLKKETIHESH